MENQNEIKLQVGVKILIQDGHGKFLFLHRNQQRYPGVQAWDFPGGRINPGVSLLENLKRELKEETGLDLQDEPKLISAQDILVPEKHIVRLTYMGKASGDIVLSDEHDQMRWFAKDELVNLPELDKYLKELLPLI